MENDKIDTRQTDVSFPSSNGITQLSPYRYKVNEGQKKKKEEIFTEFYHHDNSPYIPDKNFSQRILVKIYLKNEKKEIIVVSNLSNR